ncbi:unnamed protein product [Musa textilis]
MTTWAFEVLKQCVHKFTVFDFLKDLASKVPDVGGSNADPDDKASKKKVLRPADEDNDSEAETKRSNHVRLLAFHESSSSRRGQGRCRGKRAWFSWCRWSREGQR